MDINLSDITGVPVLMPIFREITPSITFENSAGLTPDISALKFYRIGRKLFMTGQIAFTGNGTDTGTFRMQIGLTSKGYAQSSSLTLYKAGTSAGGPGNVTMTPSTTFLYFKKDDSTTVGDIPGNLLGANTGRFVIIRGSAFFDIEGWDEYEAIGTGVATADRAGLAPPMSNLVPLSGRVSVLNGVASPTIAAQSCAHFYQFPDGTWMMWFSIRVNWTSQTVTSLSLSVSGIALIPEFQAFSALVVGAGNPIEAYSDNNGLYVTATGASTGVVIQGTVRLAGKPTI